ISFLNSPLFKFSSYSMLLFLCVGAKANVLHCVGFERWDAVLLILQKRWRFVFHFSVRLLSVVSSFRVRHNVFGLYVWAGFGAQGFNLFLKFIRSTKL